MNYFVSNEVSHENALGVNDTVTIPMVNHFEMGKILADYENIDGAHTEDVISFVRSIGIGESGDIPIKWDDEGNLVSKLFVTTLTCEMAYCRLKKVNSYEDIGFMVKTIEIAI